MKDTHTQSRESKAETRGFNGEGSERRKKRRKTTYNTWKTHTGHGKAKRSDDVTGEIWGKGCQIQCWMEGFETGPLSLCGTSIQRYSQPQHSRSRARKEKKKKKKQQSIGNWEEHKAFYPNSASTFWNCQKIRSALLRRRLSIYCIVCNTISFVSSQTLKRDLVPQNTSQCSNSITVVGGSNFLATHDANEPHGSNPMHPL